MSKIVIIGGGASGMMAAIAAARRGADVIIIEHTDRVGRKILSTGNGKCNYTNRRQGLRYYRGENPAFVLPVLKQFGFLDTIAFFEELGIVPKERDGYFYPASGQASSVLDVLRMELRRLHVEIQTNCKADSIRIKRNGFEISANLKTFFADKCIFACGGKAYPKSGSDGSAFSNIKQLGHSFIDVVPALVQMKARQSFFKSIEGIRADILVRLKINHQIVCQDRGEVQLTKTGISGIPTFQVSRYAAKALEKNENVQAILDFVPYLSKEELLEELKKRFYRHNGKTSEEALIGFFSKKLIPFFLKENQIPLQNPAESVSEEKIKQLSHYLKNVVIDLVDTEGFEKAQVSAGGVNTAEIDPKTLESLLVPGLFFAGEVIDIDGMCGGYNLQWAWSSGYVAGTHAAGYPFMHKKRVQD